MMIIMGFNHGMHVPVVSVLGTLSNYDDDNDDDNDNAKKNGFMSKTKAQHVHQDFLVHLFDVHYTTTT